MYSEAKGIVLRQTKTVNGKRVIVILTDRFGKISAGTTINEGGKNKTALALRPFTYGRYDFYTGRDYYTLSSAQTEKSFYSIGEDVDKFMAASYVLELTDKVVPEEVAAQGVLNLLLEFLEILNARKSDYQTLVAAYLVKVFEFSGCGMQLGSCASCGNKDGLCVFSVADAGLLCGDCAPAEDSSGALLFNVDADIINVLRFMKTRPIRDLEGLGLKKETGARVLRLLKSYLAYHLGIENLKSEGLVL